MSITKKLIHKLTHPRPIDCMLLFFIISILAFFLSLIIANSGAIPNADWHTISSIALYVCATIGLGYFACYLCLGNTRWPSWLQSCNKMRYTRVDEHLQHRHEQSLEHSPHHNSRNSEESLEPVADSLARAVPSITASNEIISSTVVLTIPIPLESIQKQKNSTQKDNTLTPARVSV